MMTSSGRLLVPALSAACLLIAMPAKAQKGRADNECAEFGSPSYTATRELDNGREKIASKVYVAGGKLREETTVGDAVNVRLSSDGEVAIFNTKSKTGIRLPQRPPGAMQAPAAELRTLREVKGDATQIVTQRNLRGDWVTILAVTCRSDGVLLESTFPVPTRDGAVVFNAFRHTDIKLEPIDEALFQVPADVQLKAPPPPPPPQKKP